MNERGLVGYGASPLTSNKFQAEHDSKNDPTANVMISVLSINLLKLKIEKSLIFSKCRLNKILS